MSNISPAMQYIHDELGKAAFLDLTTAAKKELLLQAKREVKLATK